MSNEHLPIDYPWAGQGWTHQVRVALERIGRRPTARAFAARLWDAMIFIAAAMMAFIVAIDGYVLLRTM